MSDKKVAYSSSSPDIFGPFFKYWTTSSGQYGLVNIRYGESSNAQVEQEIVENVAGYGKQIGRVLDAVVVLANYLGIKDESLLKDKAILDLMALNADIQLCKARGSRQDSLSLTQLIDDLPALKESDPVAFKDVAKRLETVLDELR
jgi:hypothetical protein